MDDTQLLLADEVATLLRLKPKTLETWRYRGEGPPHVKVGALVRYRRADVNAWIAAQVAG